MKKSVVKFLALVSAMALAIPVQAVAAGLPTYNFENKVQYGNTMPIEGALPNFSNIKDKEIGKEAQAIVDQFSEDTLAEVAVDKKTDIPVTTFSYETTGDGNYLSIILHAETAYANTSSHKVKTIVFDKMSPRIVSMEDVLGKSAYTNATKAVKEEISKNPEAYYSNEEAFKAVTENTDFYVSVGSGVFVIFDRYEIAPGATGVPSFLVGRVTVASTKEDAK